RTFPPDRIASLKTLHHKIVQQRLKRRLIDILEQRQLAKCCQLIHISSRVQSMTRHPHRAMPGPANPTLNSAVPPRSLPSPTPAEHSSLSNPCCNPAPCDILHASS